MPSAAVRSSKSDRKTDCVNRFTDRNARLTIKTGFAGSGLKLKENAGFCCQVPANPA